MYSVNGVTLTSTEYRVLCELIATADAEGFDRRRGVFLSDADNLRVYHSLHDKGLLSGSKLSNGYSFHGVPPQGRDFVSDLALTVELEKAERKARWRHDRRSAVIGAVSGAVVSAAFNVAVIVANSLT